MSSRFLTAKPLKLKPLHAFAIVSLLAGCFGGSDPAPEPEAKELRTDQDPLATEVPEAELTRLAKKLYQIGMYTVARDSLASLKDRYPMGAHASFAELKHADSFFFNHENDQAAKLYEDYLKNHPGSSEAPYVKLQAARSHVASARTSGRDRQPWERALVMYDDVVTTYRDTAYADVARSERIGVIRELSAYDREIIEFYRKNDNMPAVEERERRFKERWGARLSEVEQAEVAPTILSQKKLRELPALGFVATPPVSSSAIVDEPLAPLAASDTNRQATTPTSEPLIEGRIVVQAVQCTKGGGTKEGAPFATVEVSRIPDRLAVYESSSPSVGPRDGSVLLEGLKLTARQRTFDCFGFGDLEITTAGDLKIVSERPITITVLHDPPRLLLSPLND
jgi:outer membrane assembly lipoprotein YfiO